MNTASAHYDTLLSNDIRVRPRQKIDALVQVAGEIRDRKTAPELAEWLKNVPPEMLGHPGVQQAVMKSPTPVLKALIESGALRQDDEQTWNSRFTKDPSVAHRGWEHYAARRGDVELLSTMRAKGWDLDRSIQPEGVSAAATRPITMAVESGSKEAVREVFMSGAALDKGADAFLVAAARTSKKMVEEAVVYGASMDEDIKNRALATAVASTRTGVDVIHALVEVGCDVNGGVSDGAMIPKRKAQVMPVVLAAAQPEKLEVLLQKGARLDTPVSHSGLLLEEAIALSSKEGIRKMQAYGVSMRDDMSDGSRLVGKTTQAFLAIKNYVGPNHEKNTANMERLSGVLAALHKAGADFGPSEALLVSAKHDLHMSLEKQEKGGFLEALDASVAMQDLASGVRTPWERSSKEEQLAKALAPYKQDPALVSKPTLSGKVAMHGAAQYGADAVQAIENLGGSVHAVDNKGISPMHMAVLALNPSSVLALRGSGARVDVEDAWGRAPVDMASVGAERLVNKEARDLQSRGATNAETIQNELAPVRSAAAASMLHTMETVTHLGGDPTRRLRFDGKSAVDRGKAFVEGAGMGLEGEALLTRLDTVATGQKGLRLEQMRARIQSEALSNTLSATDRAKPLVSARNDAR